MSIRSRIIAANRQAEADTVVFKPGLTGTITLTGGQITISDSLTLIGPGASLIAVNGNANDRVFLVDVPAGRIDAVSALLEQRLGDYGFDAAKVADRIASFHRVENTYLSTFQFLGGLGLVLGTIGLAAVLVRNVIERRRELALLRAVGYRPGDIAAMVLAENALIMIWGLTAGAARSSATSIPSGSTPVSRGSRSPTRTLSRTGYRTSSRSCPTASAAVKSIRR